jgi:hypothetical protein
MTGALMEHLERAAGFDPFLTGRARLVARAHAPRSRLLRCRYRWSIGSVMLAYIALALLFTADQASAASGQWQAGGRLGAAWLDGAGLGPSVEAYMRRGLFESLDFDLQVLTSLHPFQPDSKLLPSRGSAGSDVAWELTVSPGVVYRWDVLRTIPYVGAGLGFYSGERHSGQGADSALGVAQFGASARLGIDYLLNRNVVLNVQASAHCLLAEGDVRLPWLQVGFGLGHAWGW